MSEVAVLFSPLGSLPLPTAKIAGSINSISPTLPLFPVGGASYGFLNEEASTKVFPAKWGQEGDVHNSEKSSKTYLENGEKKKEEEGKDSKELTRHGIKSWFCSLRRRKARGWCSVGSSKSRRCRNWSSWNYKTLNRTKISKVRERNQKTNRKRSMHK